METVRCNQIRRTCLPLSQSAQALWDFQQKMDGHIPYNLWRKGANQNHRSLKSYPYLVRKHLSYTCKLIVLISNEKLNRKYWNNVRDLDSGVQQALHGLTQSCGKYVNQAKKTDWSKPTNFHMLKIYTECPRRNVPDYGWVFLMLKYTDITQNTYIQSWTVTEIMAREVWNFNSCYTLIDYQIHIKTGRNMWFL